MEQILKHRLNLTQALASSPIDKAYGALSPADKGFCYHLVMLSLRHYDKLTAFTEFLADKKPRYKKYDRVALVLLLGEVQILFLGTPLYAVLSETPKLLTRHSDKAFHKFAHAILQKAHDNMSEFGERRNESAWLLHWREQYGDKQGEAMWQAIYDMPPLDLCFKDAQACARFASAVEAGNIGTVIGKWESSLRLETDRAVGDLPFYADGDWWVQDKAAGLAAEILHVSAGERVLDLCAAPGGKTAQFINNGAIVTAVEKSAQKIAILQENLKRLKMKCEILHQDALSYRSDEVFSAILLDAPCSASGTLRRNPELPLVKALEDVTPLAENQFSMLANAYENLLAPGGRMVYSVCSLEFEEGEAVLQRFISTYTEAKIAPLSDSMAKPLPCHISEGKYLRTNPADWHDKGRLDGFFIALIHKPAKD